MATPRGHVYLDTLQFTADPEDYARQWARRATVLPGIGGAVTIQDFGRFAKDLVLLLRSGPRQLMDHTLVTALDARAGTRGAVYAYRDWAGLEATVFIVEFRPTATFLPDLEVPLGCLYTWELTLQVTTLSKLYGAAYAGS